MFSGRLLAEQSLITGGTNGVSGTGARGIVLMARTDGYAPMVELRGAAAELQAVHSVLAGEPVPPRARGVAARRVALKADGLSLFRGFRS